MADANGVIYVNDSKATNTAAARRAVAAYDQPLHVILGGRGKGESYTELALDLAGRARRAYLIGEAARAMDVALELAGVDHELSGDLETAVRSAAKNARPGEIVLLAPACASYDQFHDFEERGEAFKRLVAEVAALKRGQLDAHILVLVTLGLTAFGLVMVYSATSAPAALGGGDPVFYLKRESIYAALGVVLLLVASRVDYRKLRYLAPVLMLTSLGLCLAVLALGQQVNGARRWLGVGPLAFQPSELAKLSLAIWASAYLARHRAPQTLKELARPIGITTGLFAGLILLEPDLGTVIAIGIVLGAILVVSGVPLRVLAAGGSIAVALGLAAIWFEPYRRARLFSFVHPWHDAQGAGFQTLQAIIGFGSGGIFGTGIGQGVAKVNYLPEAHTDMIFATIGEELGLVGAALVIAAYCAFAYAGLRVALRCRDPFGKRLAAGLTTLVCGQALVNLAAVLGLAPLTGITLPFVSYGGSSLVVSLASVGVLLNIAGHGRAASAQVSDRSRRDRRPRAAVARRRGGARRARSHGDVRRVAGSRRGAARS